MPKSRRKRASSSNSSQGASLTHRLARYRFLRARVRAPLRAAAERCAAPFVLTAFRAAADRLAALRVRATFFECLDSALFDAGARDSRFNARSVARARLRDGRFVVFRPAAKSRFARFRVDADVAPFLGGGSFTPARRAFDRPIAIACSVERAPCLPSRMCSISSRTNSPACVVAALPSRLSLLARFIVSGSGMTISFHWIADYLVAV
jgi:hypothetical protein